MKITQSRLKSIIRSVLRENKQIKINESFSLLPLLASVFTGCDQGAEKIIGEKQILFELETEVEPIVKGRGKNYKSLIINGDESDHVYTKESERDIGGNGISFFDTGYPEGKDAEGNTVKVKKLQCLWNGIVIPKTSNFQIVAYEGDREYVISRNSSFPFEDETFYNNLATRIALDGDVDLDTMIQIEADTDKGKSYHYQDESGNKIKNLVVNGYVYAEFYVYYKVSKDLENKIETPAVEQDQDSYVLKSVIPKQKVIPYSFELYKCFFQYVKEENSKKNIMQDIESMLDSSSFSF